MNKTLLLEAQRREHTGSRVATRERAQGLLPAIVYGHKQEPVAVSLNAHDFVEGLHHGHRLIDLNIDGKMQKVVVKDLQYDYLGRDIVHADLMRVDVTEAIRMTVRIELKGVAPGTQEGGIIEEHADHIEVECLASSIPETIMVPVKDIHVGDSIHASDVTLPDGVKLTSSPETLLVTCHVVAATKSTEELEEEAPTAPEVIGEKKDEADEQGQD